MQKIEEIQQICTGCRAFLHEDHYIDPSFTSLRRMDFHCELNNFDMVPLIN